MSSSGIALIRKFAVIPLFALLVGARKLLAGAPLGPPAEAGSTWSEDLRQDRRFERSLIARQIAVILLIVLLVIVRQLLS